MSFFSTLFDKIKKKGRVEVPITEIPPSPAKESQPEKDGTEVRLPSFEKAPTEIKEEKPWEAKKIPVWKPGDVILDLYGVEDVITSGGMGRIYVTNHRKWKVKVAIKSPTEEMLEDKSYFSRVVKEADAWTELGLHPNIAYCYFVRNIKEVPHLFVEYVDGGNLREWIMDGRCADLKTGLDLAIQFCHGMAYAHEKGMIHRDIKPENILMTKDGTLKVTDFGIARSGTKEDLPEKELAKWQDDTRTVGFIGTKAYASPEQWQDAHNVGEETDIFSFGVCLWEMLCGKRPYSIAVEKEKISDPRTLIPDLPESLYTLLEELVAFEVEKRKKLGGFETLRERFKSIYLELFNEPSPHSELEKLDLKADGLNNRGVSYLEVGREEDARRCWQEALKADPQHLEATFNYGYLRWQKGEIPGDVYVGQLRELETSKGSDPDYWRYLGWVHLERGDTEAVESIQQSAHRIEDDTFNRALQDKNRPVGRHLRTILGHTDRVTSVCFSPDGRYALSGSGEYTIFGRSAPSATGDYIIRLWEVESGRELRRFEGHTNGVTSVCFSPDGRHALSGSGGDPFSMGKDNTIRLWEVESGKELRRFEGHTYWVISVCFSPDGRYVLSGGNDTTIRLWEVESGRELRRFEGHTDWVRSVCFSPDGRHALSGSGGYIIFGRSALWANGDYIIRLWEVESGRELRRFEGHTNYIFSVCFSPDGRYALSGGADKSIRLWEVKSGKELRRFEGHKHWVRSVCFSPDGRYALSGGADKSIRLWEVKSGKELRRFEGHTDHVNSVSFSPDGRYAISGSGDKTVRLWEIYYPGNGWMRNHPFPFTSGVKSVTALSVERDRFKVLVKAARDSIKKGSFHEAYRLLRKGQSVPGYELDKDIRDLLTLCGVKGNGRRRGLKGAWLLRTLKGHTGLVESVCFSPDGCYALSGGADKSIRLWEVKSGKELRRFEGHTDWVYSVRFSPDGRYALSGNNDTTIRLWEVESGRELRSFGGHTGRVISVCFSTDGCYALSGSGGDPFSMGKDNTVRLWEVESGRELRSFGGHTDWVYSVCFSPDGRYALSGSDDKTIRLWEVESGRELRSFGGHTREIKSVCFSPDGRYALSGSDDKTIRLWEVESGRELRRFEGHTDWVRSVCFSPDGRYALSGSGDKTIRLWELDWEWEF